MYTQRSKLSVRELTVFAMLGAVMFGTKFVMQALPNIHLLAMFIAAFTLTYRTKALIPIYVYVLLEGIFAGFTMWWIPYLYIWTVLWGAVMLVSKLKLPKKAQIPLYMVLCGLHGLGFGLMYAPAQAVMFGLSFKAMLSWIIAGLPFDIIHGISDFAAAVFVIPLSSLLTKLESSAGKNL